MDVDDVVARPLVAVDRRLVGNASIQVGPSASSSMVGAAGGFIPVTAVVVNAAAQASRPSRTRGLRCACPAVWAGSCNYQVLSSSR